MLLLYARDRRLVRTRYVNSPVDSHIASRSINTAFARPILVLFVFKVCMEGVVTGSITVGTFYGVSVKSEASTFALPMHVQIGTP